MVKGLPLVSITIEDKYVKFNAERWYYDRGSDDTTIDQFRLFGSNCRSYTICVGAFRG